MKAVAFLNASSARPGGAAGSSLAEGGYIEATLAAADPPSTRTNHHTLALNFKIFRVFCGWFPLLCFVALRSSSSLAAPLTTLEYRIIGTQLRVSPATLSVPKGIPGSVLVELIGGGSTNGPAASALTDGVYVEATLRGPAFPARKVIGQVNAALLLPPIPLVGDYELNDIKLVDAATGATRMEGNPNRVPIHIFDDVLISRVASRPLTLAEIQEKGIVIDDANFRAVEFEIGFVLDGKTIPVRFLVVGPTFKK